jgi:fatty acid desaturase
MFLKLRITFTILSALCIAFALTAGALWGFTWTILLGLGALLFFMLMLYCKRAQEEQEQKEEESKKFFTHTPDCQPFAETNKQPFDDTPPDNQP